MTKKIILIITVAAMLLCFFSLPVAADNLIQNGDFEGDELFWESGEISEEAPYGGDYSLLFSNPISTPVDRGIPHIAEYIPEIYLEEGCLYGLSFLVCTTDSEAVVPFRSDVKFSASSNRIVLEVTGLTNSWTEVSVTFLAGKTNEFGLSFTLYSASEDTIFYIDNVSVSQMEYGPSSVQINGPSFAYIPEAGYASCQYSATLTDKNGNAYPIMTGDIYAEEPLPEGVSFDPITSSLIVESVAQPGETVTLICDPPSSTAGLSNGRYTVTLDKNMITNGSFQDSPALSGWDASSPLAPVEDGSIRFAAVTLSPVDEHLYTATLSPAKTMVFLEDTMYVFRARVRSEDGFDTRKILSPNARVEGNLISIDISDIGGGWTEVISSITVPAQGIYNLDINISSTDMRPVYIDDVRISAEEPGPADVIFNAPAHISPGGSLTIPFAFAVRDQAENIISDDASVSISPDDGGVTLSENHIIVSDNAKHGTYTITGISNQNPAASGTHSFTLSDEAVGDGGFETSIPGHLWATSPPSEFKMVTTYADRYPISGERMGRLSMNGNVSIIYSDSVKKYTQGKSYVFNAMAVKTVPDIETVVTVLLVDSYSMSLDDSLVVCQFALSDNYEHIERVFTPSESVNGKLMIAFTTPEQHDSQVILLDSISVTDATVSASGVSIGGSPFNEMVISGKYKFSSNFETTDASTYRWLMSSESNGVYIPISGQTSRSLSITPDMLDKYVKFEVTPISLNGPVTGKSVMSSYVRIGYPLPDNTEQSTENAEDTLTDIPDNSSPDDITPDNTPTDLPDNTPKGELTVIDLSPYYASAQKGYFVDMSGHWAESDVNIMAAAGIVNGRGNALFYPSDSITRAEFSAFLIRAFRLAPLYYEEGFDDVRPWDWYAGVVETITRYGIAQGVGDRMFAPDLPITREQMAVMLMRAYEKTGAPMPSGNTMSFADLSSISSWARTDVGNASALGILKGNENGCFDPQRNATRAEAISAIKRLIEKGKIS